MGPTDILKRVCYSLKKLDEGKGYSLDTIKMNIDNDGKGNLNELVSISDLKDALDIGRKAKLVKKKKNGLYRLISIELAPMMCLNI